jgi:hypothetical protein
LLRNHLREVLAAGNEEVDRYNYNWLAWSVQNPGQQATVAPVFIGDPGTGKGTLGNALCRIFGQHALHISSAEDLHGKFNDHLRQCCFLFGDECYAPQDRRAEGQVKRMITESTLMIEPKGRGKFRVPNLLHVMLASNHEWVVPAGAHERRYVVERVAETHRQDPEWFGPIYKQMQNGGYEAMLFELLHVDLGDWHPRQIVHTAALAEQQEESLSPLDAWWLYKRPSSPVPTISTRIEPRPTATKSKSSNATATAAPTAASASARAPFGATGSTIRPAASRPGSK